MVVKNGGRFACPMNERGHEMIKMINEKMTVGELVARYPQTREVLEKWGIDYCCGGKHDLKTAAAEKSINLDGTAGSSARGD